MAKPGHFSVDIRSEEAYIAEQKFSICPLRSALWEAKRSTKMGRATDFSLKAPTTPVEQLSDEIM